MAFVNSAPCVNTNGVSENDDVAGCMCTNIDSGESQQCTADEVYCKVTEGAVKCSKCKAGEKLGFGDGGTPCNPCLISVRNIQMSF